VQNFAFKFQAVAEETAKIVRGLLYFVAPCICKSYPCCKQFQHSVSIYQTLFALFTTDDR